MTNEESKELDRIIDTAGWRSFLEYVSYRARLDFRESSDIARHIEECLVSIDARIKQLIGHKATL